MKLEELKLKIEECNESVRSSQNQIYSVLEDEFGKDVIDQHIINNRGKVEVGGLIWDFYDFSQLNFFDIGFNSSYKVDFGFVLGRIGEDFFFLNKDENIVISTDFGLPVMSFKEFIEFVVILVELSLKNCLGTLDPITFRNSIMRVSDNEQYHSFITKYFKAML